MVSVKAHIKSLLRPMVRAAWPVVESIGELEARVKRGDVEVRFSDQWTPELDAALDALPPANGWPHDLYRQLVKSTNAPKRHALVLKDGAPIAIVSLRRCKFWEPVAYQVLPFTIAPARDTDSLATALNALGIEICMPAGIRDEVLELRPSAFWAYDCHRLDLTGDYEAYWNERKRHKRIRKARKATEHLQRRIDHPGDMAWTVEGWRQQWVNDPSREALAAQDRLNLWSALEGRTDAPMQLRTLMLYDGEQRIAGMVVLINGDVVLTQCSYRDQAFNDAGTATNIFLAEWAKEQGLRTIDFGGGGYKRDWGDIGVKRHGALFRPRVVQALAWATH